MSSENRSPVLPLLMLGVSLAFGFVGYSLGFQWGRVSGADDVDKVRVACDRIKERYYGTAPTDKVVDGALEGMIAKLDPFCEYFTAQEFREFDQTHLKGKFGGVGILLGSDRATGYLVVETPIEDTPAFAADILPGDLIREVDGASIKGQPFQDVVRRIKGDPGSEVTLTIARKGRDLFKVTLKRAVIQVKAVKARMLPGGVGYVRITDFTEMMKSFDEEVKKLQAQGMTSIVIDLRFNGGGLLNECVKLADRFLDDGIIVTTRGRTSDDSRSFTAEKGDTLPPMPVVVLVNEATASASEIFAGAMKDRGRAKIVGARTYGKGSVQTPFELPDKSYLKITTARYYTPSGVSVHREEGKKEFGIDPDYRVEMSQEEYAKLMKQWNAERIVKGEKVPGPEGFVDHQLEAGLEVLKAALEKREPRVAARVLEKEAKPQEN